MKHIILIILAILISLQGVSLMASDISLVDKQATEKTKALFRNLMKVQNEGKTLFGHQDAILYGRTWAGDDDRSDVKDMTGSHPAVIGLDFMGITEGNEPERQRLVKAVQDTYKRGGVTTFAWHASNPANDGSFYWESNPVKAIPDILPDGKLNENYKSYLKAIAEVSSRFVADDGELIPVIFRPFHEFDGDWFWWGKDHCTKEEFIALWQFTVEYLRDDLGVHNFIYAFSPDCKFTTEEEFLNQYPGDEYVDMLGVDDYWDFRPDGANDPLLAQLKLGIVSSIATKRNKLAAFTETGLEGVTQADWFTKILLPVLQKVNICYVLVWRNANDSEHHHYAPDKGHPAEGDFKKFCSEKDILMQSDLPDMYK